MTPARKEALRKFKAEWKKRNPEFVKADTLRWQRENREKTNAKSKKWRQKNKAVMAAHSKKRKAAKIRAVPKWNIDFFVQQAYDLARRRTRLLGFPWHVDHIVPLRSPLVCGLHAHTNIQVIEGAANIAKKNRVWPDMP